MNAINGFAKWLATEAGITTDQSLTEAKRAILDTVGCLIGGSAHPAARKTLAAVSDWGRGPASVVGDPEGLPLPWAALVNGTAMHALDFNAWTPPTCSFSPSVILAALFPLAETGGKSGAAVLDALIAGLEVSMRIGEALNPGHYCGGWHTTATIDTIGAAAACCRLAGFGSRRSGHALSIATSRASGFKSQFGTETKPLHCGLAAQSGIVAARLAESGLEADESTLDGRESLLALTCGTGAPGFDPDWDRLGAPPALDQYGIVYKRFPSCAYTHRALDGVLALREAHQVSAADVEQLTVYLPPDEVAILPFHDPLTETQARFSIPFTLAVALIRGTVNLADFTPQALASARVRTLLKRITLHSHDRSAARIDIKLNSGKHIGMEVQDAVGTPSQPLSEEGLYAKFRNLTGGYLTPDEQQRWIEEISGFEHLTDIAPLLRRLRHVQFQATDARQ